MQVIRGESGGNPMAEGGSVCIFMSPKFLLKKTWVDMLDHGSNSGKRFSKWPPEAILKKTYMSICFEPVGQF